MAVPFKIFVTLCILIVLSAFQPAVAVPVPGATQNDQYPSYNYGFDHEALLERQSNPIIPVTGALGGSGQGNSPPQRLEIRQLQQNTDLWTLYILGLDMMQYTDQNSATSWYQIAGKFYIPHCSESPSRVDDIVRYSWPTIRVLEWCCIS